MKRLITLFMAVLLIFMCGCSDGTPDGVTDLWNSDTLKEYGLKNLRCPDEAYATKWDYYEDTHAFVAVINNVTRFESFVRDIYSVASKSATGPMLDAYQNEISGYSGGYNDLMDLYVYYYYANGNKYYLSVVWYENGSATLGYDKNTVLLSVKDVAYISYDTSSSSDYSPFEDFSGVLDDFSFLEDLYNFE